MNGLRELSNIHDLQLLCSTDAVECQFDVKLERYLGVGVTIFFLDHPPPSLTANIYYFPKGGG